VAVDTLSWLLDDGFIEVKRRIEAGGFGWRLWSVGPDEERTRLPWYSALEQGLIVLRDYPRVIVDGADAPPVDCLGA
jgi:hypothetical protein